MPRASSVRTERKTVAKNPAELRAVLDRAKQFIANHLTACCSEVLECQDSGILGSGRVREAASIYAGVYTQGSLKMALDEVARQAMQRIAKDRK